jgi:hypothetical protein
MPASGGFFVNEFKVKVDGLDDVVNALNSMGGNIANALARAIDAGLRPLIGPVKEAVRVAVGARRAAKTTHWSVGMEGLKLGRKASKDGKRKSTEVTVFTPEELVRAVAADPNLMKMAKYRKALSAKGELAVSGSSGALERSISLKINKYGSKAYLNGKGQTRRTKNTGAYGRLGASSMHMVGVSPWTGNAIKINPARYSHLVENPHKIVIRGKEVGMTKGRPFIKPIFTRHIMAVQSRVKVALAHEVQQSARRSSSKSRKKIGG